MLRLVKEEPKALSAAASSAAAGLILDAVPLMMSGLRQELRASRGATLTIPQFRILANLWLGPASNKALAEQIGVSVATMSRMLQHLVDKGLVERAADPADRRAVRVKLTRSGSRRFERVRAATQTRIAQRLGGVEAGRLKTVMLGLEELQALAEEFYGRA